ncbi:MAG: hypothetical protein FJ290_18140 [Planctomycetes bacterium]|nr:hypothetical protein [Planctomycetota bacterium]
MAGEGRRGVVVGLFLVLVWAWAAGGEEKPGDAEKARLRRAALALMPKPDHEHGRYPYLCISDRDKAQTREAIQTWELLLVLDPSDAEAKMDLAICLVSLHVRGLPKGEAAGEQDAVKECLRATRLADAAVRAKPSADNTTSFYAIAQGLQRGLPDRAAEMCDYIVANPKTFQDWHVANAKQILASLRTETIFAELEKAIANAERDPETMCKLEGLMLNQAHKMPDQVLAFAAKHADSTNPLVRFLFEVAMAEILFREKKDPAALAHYDRAIEAHEAAYAATPNIIRKLYVDDVYRFKLVACQVFKKPGEARTTVLDGVRHFMKADRFSTPIAWLYFYCVTEVLKEGEEKEAIAVCDAYLKAAARDRNVQNDYGARIAEVRERLAAKLEGRPLPTFEGMTLIKGTEARNLYCPRMAVAAGKLWLAWQPWQSGGPALVHKPGSDSAEKLDGLPRDLRAVAAVGDDVFFGGSSGLYRLDADGKLLKHYTSKDGPLPSDRVVDLCEGGGKLFLSLYKWDKGSDSYVIAELDPATERLRILAPSGLNDKPGAEPVYATYRLWWDAAGSRLYANEYLLSGAPRPWRREGWTWAGEGWEAASPPADASAPRYVLSEGGEALRVSHVEGKTLFEFLKAGERLAVELPVPECVGEAALDAKRIWVPGFLGLYQVERGTGKVTWLAHQEQTQCLAVLKHAGKLYVATTRGLYACGIPQ